MLSGFSGRAPFSKSSYDGEEKPRVQKVTTYQYIGDRAVRSTPSSPSEDNWKRRYTNEASSPARIADVYYDHARKSSDDEKMRAAMKYMRLSDEQPYREEKRKR